MFFLGLTINQDVIKVYRVELVEVVIERVVNKPLKGSQGPSQSKQHNQGFKQSKVGKEYSQPLIFFFYLYVIKYRDNINL